MTGTPGLAPCVSSNTNAAGGLTPVNPFYALRYQFGMLLGVDDFESEQAYHRGKMRLHNAWLHGEGVIWGLDVQTEQPQNEIKVLPGLALDAAGRELHLDATACLDVTQWYAAHKSDAGFTTTPNADGTFTFSAYITITFQACLTRPVPAMAEPCQTGAASDTACSRVYETAKLSLLAGAPAPITKPYPRLRQLFSLDQPADAEVVGYLNPILALPSDQRPLAYEKAFWQLAALDELDLAPASASDGSILLFPAADDTFLVLALATVTLSSDASAATALTVDTSMRPVHVATSTIQDLLCGPLFHAATVAPVAGPIATPAPVYIAATASDPATLTLTFAPDLNPGTVVRETFSVTLLAPAAATPWQTVAFEIASPLVSPLTTVTLNLTPPSSPGILRLIAKGTGPAPLMGTNNIPLGGTSTSSDGQDFVWIQEVS